MDFDSSETTTNPSTEIRSVFYCPETPDYTWDLDNTTFTWILTIVKSIASPATILLNAFVIILLNQRKELKKKSNILLTSLAVADLLVGAINMPLSATTDVLILRQVSFEHICFLVDVAEVVSMYFFSFSSLYHLTVIAWERHVAIVKWMEYKVIVTRNRLKKLAIFAWLGSVFTVFPPLFIAMAGVDTEIALYFLFGWTMCVIVALAAILYFYAKMYLEIRKRKLSDISQVTALVKAKLQSKVAKTTFLLTAVAILSFFPQIVFHIVGEAFPFLRTSASFRFWELLIHINSLLNPLLYCYRDRRFRKGLLELLRIKKREAIYTTDGAARNFRRKVPFGAAEDALELKMVAKPFRPTRSASCDLTVVSDCAYGGCNKMTLKRSMSAPTLQECHNLRSLDDFQQPQPSSIVTTASAILHAEGNRRKRDKMKTKRPDPFNVVDLGIHNIAKRPRSERAASCDLAEVSDRFLGLGANEAMSKRSMSDSLLNG